MATQPVQYNTPAAVSYNSIGYEEFDLSSYIGLLRVGKNVLAVEVHQDGPTTEDALWDASLTYDLPASPTVSAPSITPAGGVFTSPVTVNIQAVPADADIYYSLNGTEPDTSSLRYTGSFVLQAGGVVKARAYMPGYNESPIATATFTILSPTQDADGDGLADLWEWQYFGDTTAAAPDADPDGDGSRNLEEYRANTHPLDSASVLKIARIEFLDPQTLRLEWTSASNTVYEVEWRGALGAATTLFEPVSGGIEATPPVNRFTIQSASPQGYYRIRVR
jgi:hypothetical protein